MNGANQNPEDLLARVADGRLDDLSPEQIAALEDYLNAAPAAAAQLAGLAPPPDAALQTPPALPTEADWDSVWNGVESELYAPAGGGVRRLIHWWRPLAAAAACLVAMLSWSGVSPNTSGDFPMQLSDEVVVHDIEVYGNEDALVRYVDDDGRVGVVWVLEDEGA